MEYNIITLGINCVPALILKDLGLRKYSLPFDWNVTNNMQIINCIEDDFRKFHRRLIFILDNHWLMDEYGIQYPHDYPTNEDETIVENWQNYQENVLEKYQRRIERFKNILNDPTPIIALYMGLLSYAVVIKKYLEKKYNRTIIFVVATYEKKNKNKDKNIIICNVYNNDDARNKTFWIDSIHEAISLVKNKQNRSMKNTITNKLFMNFT
jgi:hypothetical protein